MTSKIQTSIRLFFVCAVACAALGAAMALVACGPRQAETASEPGAGTGGGAQAEGPSGAMAGVVGEEIAYEADGITMKGYLAYDKSKQGKRPGVLVVHEWWGHNEYARRRARMLAEMGYTALAVDMYGEGKLAAHPEDAGKFAGAVFANLPGARARFEKAMEVLAQHETVAGDDLAAIGYCFGGGIVLHMARAGVDLDGVASFHGMLGTQTPAQPGQVKAAVLVAHGAEDPMISAEQVEGFKKEMDAAQVDYTFKAYEGATHSFTVPEADENAKKYDLPVAYDAEADRQSWAELAAFLQRVFAD
jgi:dienelactone hydrolase